VGDEFDGEFRTIVTGDYGVFATTTPETWHGTWTRVLDQINTPDIAAAVAKAPKLLEHAGVERLSPNERMMLGHALLLGEHLDEAWTVLAAAADDASEDNPAFAQWVWCSAAWAAWLAGDETKLEQAVDKAFTVVAAERAKRGGWNVRHWFAAWLLGRATDDEFVAACARVPWNTGAPFFVAERLRKAGKLDEAKAAYARCAKSCEEAGNAWPIGWARWRLKQAGDEAEATE
jgi:hypothetical protein